MPARAAFIAIAMLAAPCSAWGDEPNPGYIGASLGYSESSALWRIFAGHHFNRHFALEGAVLAPDSGSTAALELAAVGSLPVDERFAFYGRLGGFVTDKASSQIGVTLGAGVRFNVGKGFGVRVEWQGFASGGDLFSIGAFLRF